MSGPSPWLQLSAETVGALGSAAAAWVAVVLANRERRQRIAAQGETKELRERERRSQATHMAAWIDGEPLEPHNPGNGDQRLTFTIANLSSAPVFDLHARYRLRGAPAWRRVTPITVMAPGEKHVDTTTYPNPLWLVNTEIAFRDLAGVWWIRHDASLPEEIPGDPEFWRDDPDTGDGD